MAAFREVSSLLYLKSAPEYIIHANRIDVGYSALIAFDALEYFLALRDFFYCFYLHDGVGCFAFRIARASRVW